VRSGQQRSDVDRTRCGCTVGDVSVWMVRRRRRRQRDSGGDGQNSQYHDSSWFAHEAIGRLW
jgi:hypothetical protein